MEFQGLTPIDTIFEFSGLSMGHRLSEYLIWNGYFVGFVIAAALLRLYYVGSRKGSFTDMAVYPLYVLVIALLVWPVEVQVSAPGSETYYSDSSGRGLTGKDGLYWSPDVGSVEGQETLARPKTVPVPRLLAVVMTIVDGLQQSLVRDLDRTHFDSSFSWLRVAAINQKSRLLDLDLRHDFGLYLNFCYWPALAESKMRDGRPWDDVPLAGLPIDAWLQGQFEATPDAFRVYGRTALYPDRASLACGEFHARLESAVTDHLDLEAFHVIAINRYHELAEKEGNTTLGADAYARFYRRRLLYNETYVVAQDEMGTVRYAMPEFDLVDGSGVNLTYTNSTVQRTDSFLSNLPLAVKALPDVLAAGVSAISEWWTEKSLGPATYYRVTTLAPYLYATVTSFLLMLFPVAGLMAFWPQWWTALVNFLKILVSVKLWPVLWGYISGMIQYRTILNPDDPNGLQAAFGSEGMLPALAGMYVIAPVLSFMIVSIATQAGQIAIGSMIGSGSQGSLKTAGGAVVTGSLCLGEAGKAAYQAMD